MSEDSFKYYRAKFDVSGKLNERRGGGFRSGFELLRRDSAAWLFSTRVTNAFVQRDSRLATDELAV